MWLFTYLFYGSYNSYAISKFDEEAGDEGQSL
jgi:hypothetical protein